MTKRKQPLEIRVNVAYSPVADCDSRLRRIMELLLRPVATEVDNEREIPPDGEGINSINSGGKGENE